MLNLLFSFADMIWKKVGELDQKVDEFIHR